MDSDYNILSKCEPRVLYKMSFKLVVHLKLICDIRLVCYCTAVTCCDIWGKTTLDLNILKVNAISPLQRTNFWGGTSTSGDIIFFSKSHRCGIFGFRDSATFFISCKLHSEQCYSSICAGIEGQREALPDSWRDRVPQSGTGPPMCRIAQQTIYFSNF